MRNLYQPYITPPGCHDVPFIYLFDGNDLTNGQDYISRLNVKLDADSEFILRRIAGSSSVAEFFTYRNNSGSYVWFPAPSTVGQQADIGVIVEKSYGGTASAGQIRFDLLSANKAVAASGGSDFLAYIAFQGVKRFPDDVYPAPCAYRPQSFEYVLNVPAVDWTRGQYRRFSLKIDKTNDFELLSISQINRTNFPNTRVGIFNYMLYDPHQWQMMSAPVPDSYIVDQLNGILQTDPAPMPGVFPCPGMLYPRLSQITVDLYATESTANGDCWQIVFRGQERIPLAGNAPIYSSGGTGRSSAAASGISFGPQLEPLPGPLASAPGDTSTPAPSIPLPGIGRPWRAAFFTFNNGMPLSSVPWSSLTHLILCCADSKNGVVGQNWLEPASFPAIIAAAHAAGVKVLLSIGGDVGSATQSWRIGGYVDSIVDYINVNGFDGVDIDWETGVNPSQYADLIGRLRLALPNKLITIDTGDWDNLIPASVATFPLLDRLNVMTYDMADGAGFSWHDAAVVPGNPPVNAGTCQSRAGRLVAAGVPASKLNIGIPAYGYAWNNTTRLGDPNGVFSGQQYWYSAIKSNPAWAAGGANHRYDPDHKADYLSVPQSNQFITYTDVQGVADLVAWGRSMGVGGFFLAYLEQQFLQGMNPLASAMSVGVG